ncbi:MAG: HPr family phosphocarrier protein [Lachnospiraceae bacterium]|nr:HPr family phosphocarrier protein [Lachnospiraceae bacterium]
MEKYIIRLKTMEDVKSFNELASRSETQIDVKCRRAFVDAKSLLGVLSLGLSQTLEVLCSAHDEEFAHGIRKYCVCGG